MKNSQTAKHLGQSISLGALLILASVGVFALMSIQTGGF